MMFLDHKDAVACEIPENHKALENPMREKLPTTKEMTYLEFYNEVDKVKNKGQLIGLLVDYMRRGERRGFINADQYQDQMNKIREMSL